MLSKKRSGRIKTHQNACVEKINSPPILLRSNNNREITHYNAQGPTNSTQELSPRHSINYILFTMHCQRIAFSFWKPPSSPRPLNLLKWKAIALRIRKQKMGQRYVAVGSRVQKQFYGGRPAWRKAFPFSRHSSIRVLHDGVSLWGQATETSQVSANNSRPADRFSTNWTNISED